LGIVISSRPWLFGRAQIVFAAVVAATGFCEVADARAQGAGAPNPNVTVDLSVIDEPGAGPARRSLARPGGLRMPTPGVFPQSQLHEPDPSSLPYATLTPPRQRSVNLRPPGSKRTSPPIRALALTNPTPPPRPQEISPAPRGEIASARPQGELTSIGREPRAVEAPSRVGAVVGPTASEPQILGPDDSHPVPPPPQRTDEPEAIAATDPVSDPAAASTASTASPQPSAAETASTSPLNPELVEPTEPPPPDQPALAAKTEQGTMSPSPPEKEKAVALEPASRGEQAALPATDDSLGGEEFLQVAFAATETDLNNASRAELKGLAERLRSQENLRLQLLAYAEGEGLSPSKARRVSLSRALSVRSYLIENGIKTSRIDVRALGNQAPSAPMDRVDVKVVQR